MKKLLSIIALFAANPAHAAIGQLDPIWWVSSPDTVSTWITTYCFENDWVEDLSSGNIYRQKDCAGSPYNELFMTPAAKNILKQTSNANIAATIFTGSNTQCVLGDGSVGTCPAGSPTINNNVSRSLNSNYTISTTQNAEVSYSINVSWTIQALLSGSATAFLEYSTNSGSSWITVAQVSKNIGLLTFAGADDMNMVGTIPSNALVRIRTTATNMAVTYTRGQEVLK